MLIVQERSLATAQRKIGLRKGGCLGVVVHTTGAGPWTRAKAHGTSPYKEAIRTYSKRSVYSPHFVICGERGLITQMDSVAKQCWHVGPKGSWRYSLPGWAAGKGFDWWRLRFPDLKSPRGLLNGSLWRDGSANALTIGIEIAPPLEGPRAAWKPACWESLDRMVHWLGQVHSFPVDRYHVFTHSDAHPLARSTKKGSPWDPGPFQWSVKAASDALGFLR